MLPKFIARVLELLGGDDFEELSKIWKYIVQIGESERLYQKIEEEIEKESHSVSKMGVELIITSKLRMLRIIEASFEGDRQLMTRVEQSFENLFSRESTLSNELVTSDLMKKLNKGRLNDK